MQIWNLRTISNLSLISKLSEKIISLRIKANLTGNQPGGLLQSAYKSVHSTDTVLIQVFNYLLCNVDERKAVLLTLLDQSAAFDTVDHNYFNQAT